jgi:hypothetical protein
MAENVILLILIFSLLLANRTKYIYEPEKEIKLDGRLKQLHKYDFRTDFAIYIFSIYIDIKPFIIF